DFPADIAAIKINQPGMGEMIQRRRERRLFEHRARSGRLTLEQKGRHEAGNVLELGKLVAVRRAWPRVTGAPCSACAMAAASRSRRRMRPPDAAAASKASIQPAIAPGTVSAASGPRGGIASESR